MLFGRLRDMLQPVEPRQQGHLGSVGLNNLLINFDTRMLDDGGFWAPTISMVTSLGAVNIRYLYNTMRCQCVSGLAEHGVDDGQYI
jgi:hypothetical protein